jgi:hypothetical protein
MAFQVQQNPLKTLESKVLKKHIKVEILKQQKSMNKEFFKEMKVLLEKEFNKKTIERVGLIKTFDKIIKFILKTENNALVFYSLHNKIRKGKEIYNVELARYVNNKSEEVIITNDSACDVIFKRMIATDKIYKYVEYIHNYK